jgi:hypothetical protein
MDTLNKLVEELKLTAKDAPDHMQAIGYVDSCVTGTEGYWRGMAAGKAIYAHKLLSMIPLTAAELEIA